jgi:hypothetical protein
VGAVLAAALVLRTTHTRWRMRNRPLTPQEEQEQAALLRATLEDVKRIATVTLEDAAPFQMEGMLKQLVDRIQETLRRIDA